MRRIKKASRDPKGDKARAKRRTKSGCKQLLAKKQQRASALYTLHVTYSPAGRGGKRIVDEMLTNAACRPPSKSKNMAKIVYRSYDYKLKEDAQAASRRIRNNIKDVKDSFYHMSAYVSSGKEDQKRMDALRKKCKKLLGK